MKRNSRGIMICAMTGLLILILDSETALRGATEGITLCIRTVVPSLFPFFVFSTLLVGADSSIKLPKTIAGILRIPRSTGTLLIAGFLGGYPVGARCIAQAWRNGGIRRSDAERMLAFCNNAGPAFLFGMLSPMFPEKWMVWVLWAIQILSAILTCILLPGGGSRLEQVKPQHSITLPEATKAAVNAIAGVCGWVVLFRVFLTFLEYWCLWALPNWMQVFLSGLLELANGCCSLAQIPNTSLRMILCSAMLGFGGICVMMQTRSVTEGLSLALYWKGKLLYSVIAIVLTCGVVAAAGMEKFTMLLPAASGALCASVLTAHFIRKSQKRNSIFSPAVV